MKKIKLLILAIAGLLLLAPNAKAQNVGINTTGAAPDSSAILDISSNDKGLLIPRMSTTQRLAIVNPAKSLMVYDSTTHSFMYYNGSSWKSTSGGDQLGNHIATQNLVLPTGKWMNNNDSGLEGLTFRANGYTGIGTHPGNTPFRVKMTQSVQANIYQNTGFVVGATTYWQSFTPTISGELTSIVLQTGNYTATYELYAGEGTGGTLLTSGSISPADNATISFSNVTLTADQIYTINIPSSDASTARYSNFNPYSGGRASFGPNADLPFEVYMNVADNGFGISESNYINFNKFTIPSFKGVSNQVLTQTSSNNLLRWAFQTDTDHQNLSLSGSILSLSNDASTADLSSLLDNTDAQDLSLSGHLLSLSNDPTPAAIDLSPYLITDNQDLSLSGTTLSLSNDATPVDLSGIPIADQQDLSLSGNSLSITNDATPVDLSAYLDADNLGNHTTTQNLRLNSQWLSNDGGNEGIQIDANGQVGIGTIPETPFHVYMKNSLVEQYFPLPLYSPHVGNFWQSFTADHSGALNFIVLVDVFGASSYDYELYAGEGTGGTLLYSGSATNDTLSFSGLNLTSGQKYTFNILNSNAGFGTGYAFISNNYPGGISNITEPGGFGFTGMDINFKVLYDLIDPGFRVADTGISFNHYTFPLTDGTNSQLLSTDGSGILSWNAPLNTDAQDLSLNNDSLSLTGSTNKIDLNPYLDNTDAQDLSLNNDTLFLTNDATPVSLKDYVNTDNQDLSLSGNTLSLSNDASPVDLSVFQQDVSISNDTLFLTGDPGFAVLSSYKQSLSFANDSVYLSDDATPVGLDTYRQSLSLAGNSLSLSSDATPVDLSGYVNTDHQDLSLSGNSLTLSGDASPVDLSTITFPDQQDLSLTGNSLSLTKDATPVDMSIYLNADNLGNHLATQNIEMNNHWLSNDGGNEGVYVDAAGRVGVGMMPDADANFQAAMGAGSPGFKITDNGVGIGRTPITNIFEVEGNASKATAGDWTANSDARLKKNIVGLDADDVLNNLLSLQGVSYEWNDDKTGSKRPEGIQYGFTAQNMQAVFPSLVTEDNLGFLQTSYGDYDAHFIEAFRALNQMIEQLAAKNIALETQVSERSKQLSKLASIEAQLKEIQMMRAEIAKLSAHKTALQSTTQTDVSEE